MDILLLKPALKETIWGGRKLIDEYGMKTDLDNLAEAWMLSCHKDGESVVTNGAYSGMTLSQVIEKEGRGCLGAHNAAADGFPVLIKIIDACDRLSVQVHPGNEYARKYENENGKTEAWYVLSCEEDAQLIYGINREMTREEFSHSIENGTLLEDVNRVNVKPGDVVFIPSGMLHAIGAGILLAEVQQSSNTTYRVFDYNRKDKTGKGRELHIKKATDVVDLNVPDVDFSPKGGTVKCDGAEKTLLTSCEYFSMTHIDVTSEYTGTADGDSFVSLLILGGSGKIISGGGEYEIVKGSSVFIPADSGEYTVAGQNLSILETRT